MDIIPLTVGSLSTNCYLLTSNSNCLIIDPGSDGDFISTTTLEHKLHPLAILLTHGHFDHCLASLELKLNFNIPIFLHSSDAPLYRQASQSALHWTGEKSFKLPPPDQDLSLLKSLQIGDFSLSIIHTPGHTPGSVCFYTENFLFTGDLLFSQGTGRTDFSYSKPAQLISSLKKLTHLPDNTLIYPGHEDYGLPLHPILSQHIS